MTLYNLHYWIYPCTDYIVAHCNGLEVAGWTVDQKVQVRFPATLTACGPSDGKEVKDVFGRPGAHIGVGSAR